MGSRGLLHQPVPGHAHQPAHGRLGRLLREPHAPAARRSWRRMREAVGPDFIIIYRLSMLDLIPNGSSWDEVVDTGQARRGRRGDDHQHRHRLARGAHPDHRHQRAARPASPGSRRRCAPSCARRASRIAADHQQPHQHPRGGRERARRRQRRHGQHGPALPGRPRVRQEGAREPRRRDQHLHRLQPGLPGPHLRAEDRDLPGQPARRPTRPGAADHPARRRRQTQARRRGRRRARPGLAAATTLAERGHEVHLFDAAAEIGGQFNMARRIPGKEEFSETLRYFRRRIEITGVQLHLNKRVGGGRTCRASTRCCWPPA